MLDGRGFLLSYRDTDQLFAKQIFGNGKKKKKTASINGRNGVFGLRRAICRDFFFSPYSLMLMSVMVVFVVMVHSPRLFVYRDRFWGGVDTAVYPSVARRLWRAYAAKGNGGILAYLGIDPGGTAGGVALLGEDGDLLWLADYRRGRRGYRWRVAELGAAARSGEAPTLGATLAACVPVGTARACAVEAVGRYAGKPAPLALATSAGVAVGLVESRGVPVARPRPDTWRAVYFGRPVRLDSARAKRVALDHLHGRPHLGAPAGYSLARRAWTVAAAADWSEHAAEAAGIAAWLAWAAP